MAKYGLIIAALCTSLFLGSSCRFSGRAGSLVCSPSTTVAEKQQIRESMEESGPDRRDGKTRREPLILLRILTEF